MSKPVSASGISNGDVIHIQVDARSSASTSSALSTSSSSQHNNNAPPASSTSPSVRPTSQAPSSSSSGKRGYRVKISDDNSCLFASVAFASNPSSPADSSILRAEVAVGVLAHPALNEATLEMTQEAYAAAIQSPSKWGGEIELMLLSEIRALQLVAIDVESGAHVVYGEGSNAENISFLLYSGIHYDVFAMGPDDFKAPSSASTSSSTSTSSSKSKGNSPVVNARDLPPLHQLQTKFKAGSMEARNAMNEALQVAAQMKSVRSFVCSFGGLVLFCCGCAAVPFHCVPCHIHLS